MKVNTHILKDCLVELADIEFQRRTWLANSGPEVSSFSELVSQLFDDTGLSDVIDSHNLQEFVGDAAANKLRMLDNAISKIDQSIEPNNLIVLPEMAEIRVLAKEVLNAMPAE